MIIFWKRVQSFSITLYFGCLGYFASLISKIILPYFVLFPYVKKKKKPHLFCVILIQFVWLFLRKMTDLTMASTDLVMTEKASNFLRYLQQLEFACANSTSMDPSQQADVLRNLYLHLWRYSWLAGNSNRFAHCISLMSLWLL